jgi:hypothetical protein
MVVSNSFKAEAFASTSDEPYLILLTITQTDLSAPLRLVDDNANITSNGNLFTAFPFNMELPDNREGASPRARVSIDGTSREITEAIRTMQTAASISIEVVRASVPDTIELTWPSFNLRNVKWDAGRVSGDLVSEELEVEPFPIWQFSPANAPGLFKG